MANVNRSLNTSSSGDAEGRYLVVARRYRPRSFEQLLGQQHVAQALRNAILGNRVGHAYLFTGARGVGKTSAARIFAKALNCVTGPTPEPCNTCDICQGVDTGEDVDVLEIDGASNRGIDEIRQLRSNVSVRPSRARYKIYIIDEVHMLTTQAFNALLKTLEEPPEHVKFIFCTTDPEKIPITVLSRCQRFDFAPIGSTVILDRLEQILREEGREAEPAALALLARRAAGSMRDSQSLLEQLLAFCGPRISIDDVNAVLGVADNSTLEQVVARLLERDAASALLAADEALRRGVEAGHLAEQLLAYFRDLLVASVGGHADLALQTDPAQWSALAAQARHTGPETLMAMTQILDQALVRMRQSTHARILLELALVRIAALDRLDDLADLVAHLRKWDSGQLSAPPAAPASPAAPPAAAAAPTRGGSAPSAAGGGVAARGATSDSPAESPAEPAPEKKTPEVAERHEDRGTPSRAGAELEPQQVSDVWDQALGLLEDMTADFAACADRVAISAPNRLAVIFEATYNLQKESCERPDRKSRIEQALRQVTGIPLTVEFRVEGSATPPGPPKPHGRSTRQLIREKERHEWVARAVELFDAEILRLEPGRAPGGAGIREA